jgi:hypothetical protein
MAVAGPDRSGSGPGVPVPRRTTRVWVLGGVSWGCPAANEAARSAEATVRVALLLIP